MSRLFPLLVECLYLFTCQWWKSWKDLLWPGKSTRKQWKNGKNFSNFATAMLFLLKCFRISLIKRAGCLFMVILGFIVSSVIYINNQKTLWSIYQFGVVNILMVCILAWINTFLLGKSGWVADLACFQLLQFKFDKCLYSETGYGVSEGI